MKKERVFIGIGSNQGDSLQICLHAVVMVREDARFDVHAISSFYRSEPVGVTDQPWFVNAVLCCETSLEPLELLGALQRIENHFGRVRSEMWGPRTLDMDILAYGDRVVEMPGLTIPHPRMHERRFVLVPLLEIAPHWVHPRLKSPVADLLAQLAWQEEHQAVEKLEMK